MGLQALQSRVALADLARQQGREKDDECQQEQQQGGSAGDHSRGLASL